MIYTDYFLKGNGLYKAVFFQGTLLILYITSSVNLKFLLLIYRLFFFSFIRFKQKELSNMEILLLDKLYVFW